ncbi:MAG: glycosyltransferase family 4 protein [Desulfomonile tiedjei]|nr:glycosyltransferase family 4 protein [Desulfomonile tiedjei]
MDWSPQRLSLISRAFRPRRLLLRLQRFSVFARRHADHTDSSGNSFLSRLEAQVVGSIWKALRHAIPPGLRGKIKDWLLKAAAPEPIRKPHAEPRSKELLNREFGINVIGYITAEMGLGEAARGSARAAAVSGIPTAVIDFRDGVAGRMREEVPGVLSSRPSYGVSLFHIRAPELFEHSMRFSDLEPSRTYNIGFWFWETSELPDSWMPAFNYLDEIWAASTFCLDVFSRKSPVPVVRIPVCVEPVPAAALSREDLGLPRSGFLFLSMADFFSGPERKNPLGVLEAFQRAFPSSSEEAYLVLKMTNSEHRPEILETVRERLKADSRIILIDGYLDRPELNALINNCDCLVSLHRAEGFGLPIAEAMYMGKPTIATGWSANMDFMTIDNSLPVRYQLIPVNQTSGPYRDCKGFWADPELDHASQQMRRVAFDASLAEGLGGAARKTMREEYSAEAVGQLMRQRLQIIYDHLRHRLSERD